MLGPVLIIGALLLAWLDELVASLPAPGWLSPVLGERETLPPGVFVFLGAVTAVVFGSREIAAILRAHGVIASNRVTALCGVLGLVGVAAACTLASPLLASMSIATAALAAMIVAMRRYSFGGRVEGVTLATSGALLAFCYLGLLSGFFLAIRRDHSAWTLLGIVLVAKSCDIGAYFAGRAFGRRKLITWLSPGKTWEGLAGGVTLSTAVGAAGAALGQEAGLSLDWWQGAVIGAALGLVGQAGDLVESLLKRDAGMKDSSTLLPGFGGALDVIDSALLAAPVAFWLLVLFTH